MKVLDSRTEGQIRRDKRDADICAEYVQNIGRHDPWGLCRALSKKYDLTSERIRTILKNKGYYK